MLNENIYFYVTVRRVHVARKKVLGVPETTETRFMHINIRLVTYGVHDLHKFRTFNAIFVLMH